MRARRYQSRDSVISPAELEFLAEEENVTIVSKISTSESDAAGRAGYLSMLAGALICSNDTGQHQRRVKVEHNSCRYCREAGS